jgi:ERCC4-type nuclease
MLVSAAEPPTLRALGQFSPLCEQYGADIMYLTTNGELVGVQRKEIHDLVSSLGERLNRELAKMAGLDVRVLLVEGEWRWTANGDALSLGSYGRKFSRKSYDGLIRAVQHQGIWVATTDNLSHTAEWLVASEDWFNHRDHTSLSTRPKPPRDMFGTRDSAGWRLHWWQTFEGIGAVQAKELDAHFEGQIPTTWFYDGGVMSHADWIMRVTGCKGIGKKRAEVMWDALNGRNG